MISTKRIRARFGKNICRRCINSVYHVRLNQRDCLYTYTYQCTNCGEMHHIVVGFQGAGRLKMLMKF